MIEYLKNQQVAELLNAASEYQKKEKTGLRLPLAEEIGSEKATFVKDGEAYRQESSAVILSTHIIARNAEVIGVKDGVEIHNEWPISKETAIKNYGQEVVDVLVGESFSYHPKKAKLKAFEIDDAVMNLLSTDGESIFIKVEWSKDPMIAKKGDYLTDGGYSISAHDMKSYELVSAPKKLKM